MSERVRARVEAGEGRPYFYRRYNCWRVIPHLVPDNERARNGVRHSHAAIDESILLAIGRSESTRSEIYRSVLDDYGTVTMRTVERRLRALLDAGLVVRAEHGTYARARKSVST